MKLPSGFEVSNSNIAELIDYVVLRAMEEESFSDSWNSLVDELAGDGWDFDGSGSEKRLSEEDAVALAREIRETAGEFWLKLWEQFGKLHVDIVHAKYPHDN
jgi:hypothetical protein